MEMPRAFVCRSFLAYSERAAARPGNPGPKLVKKRTICPNGPVLHFFTNERTAEIGRDRRSRPRNVRSATPARAAGPGSDAGRSRGPRGPHAVGALADRERPPGAEAVAGRADRDRARRADDRAAQEAAAESPGSARGRPRARPARPLLPGA